jgi:hypothetical protein
MAVIARTNKTRPGKRGLVVEVHDRPGIFRTPDVFDLLIVLWSPVFGVHAHTITAVQGRTRAIEIAEHIGQTKAQVIK